MWRVQACEGGATGRALSVQAAGRQGGKTLSSSTHNTSSRGRASRGSEGSWAGWWPWGVSGGTYVRLCLWVCDLSCIHVCPYSSHLLVHTSAYIPNPLHLHVIHPTNRHRARALLFPPSSPFPSNPEQPEQANNDDDTLHSLAHALVLKAVAVEEEAMLHAAVAQAEQARAQALVLLFVDSAPAAPPPAGVVDVVSCEPEGITAAATDASAVFAAHRAAFEAHAALASMGLVGNGVVKEAAALRWLARVYVWAYKVCMWVGW